MGAITGQKPGASVKKARHSIWNRHNQKVCIFKIKRPLAAMRKSGLVADLRQRSAKHSLGWPECQLPTQRDGWLARAANVGFSNWVFRSSSFSLFVLGLCHSSGSRFSSQSGLMFEWHRCKHMSDRQWRAPLSGALQDAQQTFSASSTNLVR